MQVQLTLRLYEELNDYLPPDKRKVSFAHAVEDGSTVEDVLRILGVPRDEIELVLVNGEPADFSHRLHNGDRVSVYPVFESLDISSQLRVRARPLRELRFVVAGNLNRLARTLRMLGFDTLYRSDCTNDELVALSQKERRILLSRDHALAHDSSLTHAYHVRANTPREQQRECPAKRVASREP
jgi:sulfur carrier protein ThiS